MSPDNPLFTVVNLNSVWVQLNLYQKDLPLIRLGHAGHRASDTAPGRRFSGTVSHIGDQVDETTRTVKVRCVIRNAGDVLKPQTFVRGTIATTGRAQALAVPQDAVQEVEGKNGRLRAVGRSRASSRRRPVEVGRAVGGRTVIRSGLKPGSRVVTQSAFVVKAQAMKSELTEDVTMIDARPPLLHPAARLRHPAPGPAARCSRGSGARRSCRSTRCRTSPTSRCRSTRSRRPWPRGGGAPDHLSAGSGALRPAPPPGDPLDLPVRTVPGDGRSSRTTSTSISPGSS